MTTHSRAKEFRDQLESRALVADGAMGTMLYAKGVFINRCYDELNLSSPDLVRGVHQEYVKAGAEILETQYLRRQPDAPGRIRHRRQAARHQSGGRAHRPRSRRQ